ncbi:UDP-N-acetylmuramate--L-alanine ligase [bacterium]|nr:UDP-N-acetylmuramate--L-alanine ligase [bacterium]
MTPQELNNRTVPQNDIRPASQAPAIAQPKDPLGFASAHLIGIGGCGMSAIAHALMASGIRVTGSDMNCGASCHKLITSGAKVFSGHAADNLPITVDRVILSSAIPKNNPEYIAAVERNLPIVHRSEALAMFLQTRQSVLISGTHGKTTTSAMMGLLMEAAGFDPWVFVGGRVPAFDGNVRIGGLEWAVAEADESDGTFERLPAQHLIVTNVESDHMDYWGTEVRMVEGYRRVVQAVPELGHVLMCIDDVGACRLRHMVNRPVKTYSVRAQTGDFSAARIDLGPLESSFDIYAGKKFVRRYTLGVPGLQNVENAVGTIALALLLGADPESLDGALENFHGVGRRFEIKGRVNGITVVDDYAHHPTEISATIAAARRAATDSGGRLIVIFQPHRFTRTRDLLGGFAVAFAGCDQVILTDIYSAGEEPIAGVTIETLAKRLENAGQKNLSVIPQRREIAPQLAGRLRAGDLVMTMGAGDNYRTAGDLLQLLESVNEGM